MAGPSHFDAIVIGSGFGGAVTAYRLAEAGKSVCILERGKAWAPGSFPRTPAESRAALWDPGGGLHGLIDVWSFRRLFAIVASAVGGGSLIYSNVLLRKDERTFVHEDLRRDGNERWPVSRADLEPHYDEVERHMGATRYPFDVAPYSLTRKTRAMFDAAEAIGAPIELPKLAITFGNPGMSPRPGEPIHEAFPNPYGSPRSACRLCGECNLGCNSGSKNTLDFTYLAEATRLGAELRARCEVRDLAPRAGSGYVVRYVDRSGQVDGEKVDTSSLVHLSITADKVIVAAGALGSTFLLLKNRETLPALSSRLGERCSGNGDLLTFLTGAKERKRGELVARSLEPTRGPVITASIRFDEERLFYLQDAGFPDFVAWLVESAHAGSAISRAARLLYRLGSGWLGIEQSPDVAGAFADLIGACEASTSSLPLLGMGREFPESRLFLDARGYLEHESPPSARSRSRAYYERVRDGARQVADVLGGQLLDTPLWMLGRGVTVHPVGGCAMGRNADEGVVDSFGEVFGHPGLYVADGSVMPGAVGPNPSLTIAALADRFAARMLRA